MLRVIAVVKHRSGAIIYPGHRDNKLERNLINT